MSVQTIDSADAFDAWCLTNPGSLHVVFLYADFHAPSCAGGQLDGVVAKLAELHSGVRFGKVDAEALADVADQFDVSVVPTFVFIKSRLAVGRLEGAAVAELAKRVEQLRVAQPPAGSPVVRSLAALTERLDRLIRAAPIMAFIKGTPEAPRCKFSRRLVELLAEAGARYGSFDVLTSEAVRAGLKLHSQWPTFPQLFVGGKLLGGVDIVQELRDSGELAAALAAAPPPPAEAGAAAVTMRAAVAPTVVPPPPAAAGAGPALAPDGSLLPEVEARLRGLFSMAPVLLFMKGNPAAPACGFSAAAVDLLRSARVPFVTVDVLRDPQARAGLPVLNAFPTFPQLVVRGQLVGGLDILRQLVEEGGGRTLPDLLGVPAEPEGGDASAAAAVAAQPPAVTETLDERLARLTRAAHVVLFMKGSPAAPRCGFSAEALRLLEAAGVSPASTGPRFASVDVLADPAVREGMKRFWPTFPQLYVDGKLLGGVDIMREMGDELADAVK